jgi:hypothetical protein
MGLAHAAIDASLFSCWRYDEHLSEIPEEGMKGLWVEFWVAFCQFKARYG